MGWKRVLRAVEADARRQERARVRHQRELQKRAAQLQKLEEKEHAANEVAQFENYLEIIVSLHEEAGDPWDWQAISTAPEPAAPKHDDRRQVAAAERVASYRPGFFARFFGLDKRRLAALEAAVGQARTEDAAEYDEALASHRLAIAKWEERRRLGTGVLARNPAIYQEALRYVGPFDELTNFGARVSVTRADPDVVAIACEITDPDLVPKEELKLTAGGKLSTKEMPAGRYWPLYQDYVCSAAIRIAREIFGVLPIDRAIVNVGETRTNTATGHPELSCLLAVHFLRNSLQRLKLDKIDPSDSMKNFSHRMKFKKTTGFEPVEPITVDEQWVTTG